MDLRELQSEARRLLEGLEHPRMGAGLALAEECGEVVRCVLDHECYGLDTRAALEAEIGDVLVALAEVSDRYGVSLDDAARGALAKLERKAPEWRAQIGDRLARLRERVDGPTL